MTEKYISASYITDALGVFNDRVNGNEHFLNGIDTAKEIVDGAPAADVRHTTHGAWVWDEDPFDDPWHRFHKCSICGKYALNDDNKHEVLSDFCPRCGADMRDGKTDTV